MAKLGVYSKNIFKPLSRYIHEYWAVFLPKSYVKYWYKKTLNKKLNLKNPHDFNEKVQWLKIYSDTSQWSDLYDKYKVREYLKECGLSNILVQLYGVWKNADQIDFNLLPEKFVLKTNHGCGNIIIVNNKSELDTDKTRYQLNKWVKEKYGLIAFQPHARKIERRIIAEELLQDKVHSTLSSSLIDYKFYCINGEPQIIIALYDRIKSSVGSQMEAKDPPVKACVYDLDWNIRPEILAGHLPHNKSTEIPKPKCFDEMISICRILSRPFPQVRVDLYEVNNKVYFGELTFTPGGGMNYFTDEYFLELGRKMDLSGVKRIHPLKQSYSLLKYI